MRTSAFTSEIDAILQPLGFQRRKNVWNRRDDRFVDVIDLQRTKAGDTATLNLGVVEPGAYELCWGEQPPVFIQEPFCTVRTRLLDEGGRELWWSVADVASPSRMGEQLQTQGLRFINSMHSSAAQREWLERSALQKYPPNAIYLAWIMADQGDHEHACALLKSLRRRPVGAFLEKVERAAIQLGCGE